jgi:hypothetical protein
VANINKVIGGRRAKARGASFERVFEQTCIVQGVDCLRILDGCRRIGQYKIIPAAQGFDFIIGVENKSAFIDTKCVEKGNFTFSQIKPHQLAAFEKLKRSGVGGYVINFEKEVYFAPLNVLREVLPGKSVDIEKCKHLGNDLFFDVRRIFDETS